MDMIGDRRFVDIPGDGTHELPPLLLRGLQGAKNLFKMMEIANSIVEQEDMLAAVADDVTCTVEEMERRKLDLALNLVDQYRDVLAHWQWGDCVLEWIRQCEITFGARHELKNLLRSDLWPHAGRSSFVTLLEDKSVRTEGVDLEKAVGLRLAFRQMPPIRYCSDQFLFYLNSSLGATAYNTWSGMTPKPIASLPPERFAFEVHNLDVELH
jgi:hypothetical protein